MAEPEALGGEGQGNVDDPLAVDVAFEGPFVEGEGKVVPLSGFEGIVFTVIIREAVVQAHFLFALDGRSTIRLQNAPGEAGRAVTSVIKIDIAGLVFVIGAGKNQDEVIAAAFPFVFVISGSSQEDVIFQGEYVRKERARLFHQGNHGSASVVREGDDLSAFDGSYLCITADEVPPGREFAQLFACKVVFKENLVAGDKVTLGVGRAHRFLLGGGFGGRGGRVGGLGRFGLFLSLLADVSVQDIVYALFYFLADVLLGGILGSFAQSLQKTLGFGVAAQDGQHGNRQK